MFFRYTSPALIWAIVISTLCLLPGDQLPQDPIVNADKIYHAGAFGLLSFLFAFGFSKQSANPILAKYASWVSIVISSALGGLIEILQEKYIRNRHGDWLDFAFDAAGAVVGVIIFGLVMRYVNNRKNYHHPR